MPTTPATRTPGPPATAGGPPPGRPRQAALPVACGTTACLLPILKPAGPGNTAAADLGIVVCIVCALMWAVRERVPQRFPYAVGMLLMMIGGALGAAVSQAPLSTVLPLLQDVLLLLWAATLALGCHDPAIVRATTHAWCRLVPVYSAIVVVAYLIGLSALSGVSAKDGARAAYTFADPNLAGNYLVVSLFVMAACERPRSPGIRRVSYLVVLVAITFTGSNGAMLTLLVGSVLSFALLTFRSRGVLPGLLALTATTTLAAVAVLVVLPRVDLDSVRERAASSVPLLRDSLGRSGGSTSERQTILVEGSRLYLDGNALGYGPALTKSALEASQAPYVKEAHNDYLATLLERGVLGTVGLIVLGFSIGMRAVRLTVGRVPEGLKDAVPRPWLLAAIFPVMVVAGTFYEVLHFRHLWTWLGVVAAIALAMRAERTTGPVVPADSVRDGGSTR